MAAAKKISFYKTLPHSLPEPLIWISEENKSVCQNNNILKKFVPHLPCWISHRIIADAQGYNYNGIDNAIKSNDSKPYVWATEFENVHGFWKYKEQSIMKYRVLYRGSEHYYQKNKPHYKSDGFSVDRVDVMRDALYYKFLGPGDQRKQLRSLLVSTHPHTLLSLKPDDFWGVTVDGKGENMLAVLLMELRNSLI